MTTPFLPPIKDAEGLTSRELLMATRTTDDGDPVVPPYAPPQPPTVTLPIADGADVTVMLEQPVAETAYWDSQKPWYDSSAQTEIRIVTDVEDIGAPDAALVAKYSTTPNDPDSYVAPATAPVVVEINAAGPQKGGWFPLVTAARADVAWTIRAQGGDGAMTPAIGKAHLQFRQAPSVAMEKWYWRDLDPADFPEVFDIDADPPPCGTPECCGGVDAVDNLNLIPGWKERDTRPEYPPSWVFDGDESDVLFYTAPTWDDVQAVPRVLMRERAPDNLGATVFTSESDDGHWNLIGPIGRLVGPPLAAQTVPDFVFQHWYAGTAPSASTDGTIITRLWVWRPGVGRIHRRTPNVITQDDLDLAALTPGIGTTANIAWDNVDGNDCYAWNGSSGWGGDVAGGSIGGDDAYFRYIARQQFRTGFFRGFEAEAGDRFILDLAGSNRIYGGFLNTTGGTGVYAHYNGTVEPTDPAGFADGFAGVASYTLLPRLTYIGDS